MAPSRRGGPFRKPQARIDAAIRTIEELGPGPVHRPRVTGVTPRLGDKVVECIDAGFRYGDGPVVLAGVDLTLGRRERLGIVGANGSGKSTLVDLLAGRRRPTSGRVETGGPWSPGTTTSRARSSIRRPGCRTW